MNIQNSRNWRFSRQVNVSMVVQLILLAFLIVGSWINLQSRLDVLQRDVGMLLTKQQEFQKELRMLSEKSITYEFRLQSLERQTRNTQYSRQ
jgi:hypothetical protein